MAVSLRRAKAIRADKRTANLRAVRFLLGHVKIESTVQYPDVEAEDALAPSEQIELSKRLLAHQAGRLA